MATRTAAALQGLFVGDALSMPVHWYYRVGDIVREFGPHGITDLQPAPARHPSSIMSLHDTARGGRRSAASSRRGAAANQPRPDIVGEVILKGRRERWNVPGGHYHHGMPAGENTLNAWCARWLIEQLGDAGEYHLDAWLQRYTERMTADPPAHPDSYAESYHRGFFANLSAGKPMRECAAVTHDTPSMGALVTVAPLALALLPGRPLEAVQASCREHVRATHPDALLLSVVDAYVALLHELLQGPDADRRQAALVRAAAAVPGTRLDTLLAAGRTDAQMIGGHWSTACYISDSWPSVCWLAARHTDDIDRALRVNTNLGGENAHRGAVLGTLIGAATGQGPSLFERLHRHDELQPLLRRFERTFVTA